MTTLFRRPDRLEGPLHVLTSVFDPQRYRSRWKLYKDFAKRVAEAGAVLYTVEVAFGRRAFAVTEAGNPHHIQLRTSSMLWHKETALNLAARHVPDDGNPIALIDADVRFARDDWADETLHALQAHPVVQMWSEAFDLSPEHEQARAYRSYAWCLRNQLAPGVPNLDQSARTGEYTTPGTTPRTRHAWYWHPGFAWAMRRETWNALGGLIDHTITGSADYYMALALTGRIGASDINSRGIAGTAERWIRQWEARAAEVVRGDVGYVPGALLHFFHGSKANRRYRERDDIMRRSHFDPERDLVRDIQGLWQLAPGATRLRDDLIDYFAARREDE